MPSTVGSGNANVSSPTLTISACVIASVYGKRIKKRVPSPLRVSMRIEPPSFLTSLSTTSMPTPRPAACVSSLAVLKPGWRINSTACSSVILSILGEQALLVGLAADRGEIEAAAVVARPR